MSRFKYNALQNFINDGEKDHPPVFVGRDDIFKNILTKARRTGERKTSIPGNTTVIQGAPGAGKSSILGYLTRLNVADNEPKALSISSVELEENFPDILLAIAALGRTDKSKLKNMALKTAQSAGGLALLDVLGLIDLNLQNLKGLFQSHDIRNIGSLHKAFPMEQWDTPVIVAVDEAQNLPSGRDSQQARFLRALHEAVTKLPLTLVMAGLGDTRERLQSMGLTQGVHAWSIGGLTQEETDLLTDKWCAHFGIRVGAQRSRIDALIARTDGWPRHVHWAQQALAEVLLQKGVEGQADRIPDWRAVRARSDQLRQGYYNTQYSNVMVESRKLVARVMLEVAQSEQEGAFFEYDEIAGLVEKFAKKDGEPGWRLPKPHDSFSYVTHLIHCGALQQDPDRFAMTCPIPSFQSYILQRGGIDPSTISHPMSPTTLKDDD